MDCYDLMKGKTELTVYVIYNIITLSRETAFHEIVVFSVSLQVQDLLIHKYKKCNQLKVSAIFVMQINPLTWDLKSA